MTAPPPGPPPQSGMSGAAKGCLIAFAIVAVLGIAGILAVAFLVDEAVDEIGDNVGEADEGDYDIEPTACLAESNGFPTMEGEFTNTSDRQRSFTVEVTFTADGVRIGTADVFIDSLGEDITTAWRATSFDILPEGTDPSEISCNIDQVSYWF